MSYQDFLTAKIIRANPAGFNVGSLHTSLFPFQADIVRWALRLGRAATFADCGMGKTLMQLEWASHVCAHTGGSVLILAPLAVSSQTAAEGRAFGYSVQVCRSQADVAPGINITNYEMLHAFDPTAFAGVILDESSILKSFNGKVRTSLIEAFSRTPYRLACTATPAPNDFMELGNHAEFLGVMTRAEMLAMFFTHDTAGSTQSWRLKGHAQAEFWRWVCSWAVMVRRPSDLGYDDGAFVLLGLHHHSHVVGHASDHGELWAREARTLSERRKARRDSLVERCAVAAELANSSHEQWLIWCDLNDESATLTASIPGAVEVKGADSKEHKETSMLGFAAGDIRVLITKPSIAGFGMNWQGCHNMAFTGLSDSYEAYYQAVRRCWRFGQTQPVHVHVVTAEAEGAVVDNIRRKERDARAMAEGMVAHVLDAMRGEISRHTADQFYQPTNAMLLPAWLGG